MKLCHTALLKKMSCFSQGFLLERQILFLGRMTNMSFRSVWIMRWLYFSRSRYWWFVDNDNSMSWSGFLYKYWLVIHVFQILHNITSRLLDMYASFSYSHIISYCSFLWASHSFSLMYFQQAEQLMANAVKQSMGLIDCKVNQNAAN